MKKTTQTVARLSCLALALALAGHVDAQDWTQWRGANRDAKATGFNAPKTWPKTLTQKWKMTVGDGVATPALVGERLYVFSRQDGNEVLRALEAGTGKEVWQEKYESLGASGPAQGFSGPRSSPVVANGKVVTLGVRGMLSCVDAANGQKIWRKDDFQAYPRFHPSSSPVILDNLCIAQLGGSENGALAAYDLGTGDQKWKWTGPSPSYASPALMTVDGTKIIVAQTETKLVAVGATDGRLLWESAAAAQGGGGGAGGGGAGGGPGGRGGGRDYKASSPIVDGQTVISAGRGVKAIKFEKGGDGLIGKELWNNTEKVVSFSSPVLKNGLLYGLTGGNEIFCLNAQSGQVAWSASASASESARAERPPGEPSGAGDAASPGAQGGGGQGGRGRGGRGGGGGGYGSLVDAGSVLLALTPSSELIVFEPGDKAYKELARIKVAETPTHAYPVISGNRVFIKDKDSLTLWSVE